MSEEKAWTIGGFVEFFLIILTVIGAIYNKETLSFGSITAALMFIWLLPWAFMLQLGILGDKKIRKE